MTLVCGSTSKHRNRVPRPRNCGAPSSGSDTRTENSLVEQYLPLFRFAVGRPATTLPDHVDHDDLHSAGLVGLLQALRNFDPACNTSFESYARVRVRGAMLDELRRMDWVPRTVHEKAGGSRKSWPSWNRNSGGLRMEAQMAKALNLSISEYSELLDKIRPVVFVCLDATCNFDSSDSASLYEVVADPADNNPIEEVSRRELKQVILNRLSNCRKFNARFLPAIMAKICTCGRQPRSSGLPSCAFARFIRRPFFPFAPTCSVTKPA